MVASLLVSVVGADGASSAILHRLLRGFWIFMKNDWRR